MEIRKAAFNLNDEDLKTLRDLAGQPEPSLEERLRQAQLDSQFLQEGTTPTLKIVGEESDNA